MARNKFVSFFKDLTIKDVPQVGGKNASLGEMYGHLTKQGIKVPNGFATTAYAYNYFLEKTGLKPKIKAILKGLDTKNVDDLMARGLAVRKLIVAAELPADLVKAIKDAYRELANFYKTKDLHVAVRSSATAEDLPDASFAGHRKLF